MGMTVAIHEFDLEILLQRLWNKGARGRESILEALAKFGIVTDDKYFLLQNDHAEDYNSYFQVAEFFDRAFAVKDSFDCFLEYQGCIYGVNAEEVADEMGIELSESEED